MYNLKERFLKAYANVPLNLRDEIILVLSDKRTISWDVAYFAIRFGDGEQVSEILEGLKDLQLI